MKPKSIIDKAIALINGSVLTTSGKNTNPVTADADVETPQEIPDKIPPQPVIAQDVSGQSFDSQTKVFKAPFKFEQLGGLTIGEYIHLVSGQIEITRDGITATDLNGVVTFHLDGATGGATFLGTVVAGTILAGTIITDAVVQDGSININNAFEIDTSGNLKLKNNANIGPIIFWDDGVAQGNEIARIDAADGLKMFTNKPVTLRGTATPSAPAANGVTLYVDQSGGKDRLMALFSSGAAQQVAIQP
jgi:hypothetical protein